jgi:anaerobic ribonucleoside-triphosphate reductase
MLDRSKVLPQYQNLADEEIAKIPITRIRRITGYLVGDRDSRFNDAKRAEEHDRVKHGLSEIKKG